MLLSLWKNSLLGDSNEGDSGHTPCAFMRFEIRRHSHPGNLGQPIGNDCRSHRERISITLTLLVWGADLYISTDDDDGGGGGSHLIIKKRAYVRRSDGYKA